MVRAYLYTWGDGRHTGERVTPAGSSLQSRHASGPACSGPSLAVLQTGVTAGLKSGVFPCSAAEGEFLPCRNEELDLVSGGGCALQASDGRHWHGCGDRIQIATDLVCMFCPIG